MSLKEKESFQYFKESHKHFLPNLSLMKYSYNADVLAQVYKTTGFKYIFEVYLIIVR